MLPADRLPRLAFAALCAATLAGFLLYPTYPNYDSYYSLLWGREVLDLQLPHFEGFRVPTQHPLAIAAGALLSLAGEHGDRLWTAAILGSFLALVAGVYRLGRVAFTPLVGAIAAGLLLSRFDFAFLAARGTPVFALLAAAGLLRPEGWVMAGLYFLWMSARSTWPRRLGWAAWAAVAPLGWAGVDYAVTGDPLFSLTYTSSSAEDLGRSRSFSEIPGALPGFLSSLIKLPVLVASVAGLGIAAWLAPRRTLGPLLLLATGIGTFLAVAAAGASVIERYLVIAALALLIFAAVAVGGWTLLEPGRLRAAWKWGAVAAVAGAAAWTVSNLDLRRFDNELSFRGDAHDALTAVLRHPDVLGALDCGPLTLPNHKLVPDARWIADLPFEEVFSRAEVARRELQLPERGVEVYATSRFAIFKHAYTDPSDPARIQVPRDGWLPVARSDHYAAYARC